MRFALPLGIFAALLLVLGIGLTRDPKLVPSPLIGKPVAEFALATLADEDRHLRRGDLLGKPYLLNVWASWCVACRDEHPLLLELASKQLIDVIGLNYKDERPAAQDWLNARGNPYRLNLFDPNGKLGLDLGVYGVPETFVIDAAGIIRHKHIGPLDAQILNDELLPVIRALQGS